MKFRHEWKIEITKSDHIVLRSRLLAVMKPDPHAENGRYSIRSLYFDDPVDRALREKIDGTDRREKFRIRYYNGDTDYIALEKKSKRNGLCSKQSARITKEQAGAILSGDIEFLRDSENALFRELYLKMKTRSLRPKTVVDYTREPFVYAAGNVRVTFDYDIRTGLSKTDFLSENLVTIPAGDAPILMEVKWDEFLPDIIRDVIQLSGRRAEAFSKYAQARIYG